jgi:hypothetical protein
VYVVALVFLLGAVGALAIGFFQSGLTLILISIGASLISAFFLLVGMLRTKTVRRATAGAPYEPPAREPELPEPAPEVAVLPRPVEPGVLRDIPVSRPQVGIPASRRPSDMAVLEKKPSRRKLARKGGAKPGGKKAAARKPAASRALGPTSRVTITEQGKYHRPSCRFVKEKRGLQTMARNAAEDAGHAPCGVCKP